MSPERPIQSFWWWFFLSSSEPRQSSYAFHEKHVPYSAMFQPSSQKILDLWIEDTPDIRAIKSTFNLDEKHHKAARNILMCGCKETVSSCPEHPEVQDKTRYKCHSRYCKQYEDLKYKAARAKERIGMKFGIQPAPHKRFDDTPKRTAEIKALKQHRKKELKKKRLYHLAVGSNRGITKQELELDLNKVFSKYRKEGRKMYYIKVFDIGRKNATCVDNLFLHYHIALYGETIKRSHVAAFMAGFKKKLHDVNPDLVYRNAGWRPLLSIMHYFGRRIAGIYGHKGSYYYLNDILTLPQFFEMFYNRRVFSSFLPKGLGSKGVPKSLPKLCYICKMPLEFTCYELIDHETNKNVRKPPD